MTSSTPFAQADPLPRMLFPHTLFYLAILTHSWSCTRGSFLWEAFPECPLHQEASPGARFSAPPRRPGFGIGGPASSLVAGCGRALVPLSAEPRGRSRAQPAGPCTLSLALSLAAGGSLIWCCPGLTIQSRPPIAPCGSVCAPVPSEAACGPGAEPQHVPASTRLSSPWLGSP